MQKVESVILFDGWCNLCNSSVQFILRFDKKRKFKFASLQSDSAKELEVLTKINSSNSNSIVLILGDKYYLKSSAAVRIAKELSFPINLLYIFILVPPVMRDAIYSLIAKNRYSWFGKRPSCTLQSEELKERLL